MDMKITEIEVIELRAPGFDASYYDSSWSTCVIRIHTDSGISGISEVDSVPSVVRAIIEADTYHSQAIGLKSALLGQDPLNVEGLWDRMYQETYLYGRRGAVIHTISGIDIALWDIRAKVAGKTVSSLLGGSSRRTKIKAYGTVYPLGRTHGEILQHLDNALQRGLRAFKICAEPIWQEEPDAVSDIIQTVRSHIGPEADLMVDGVAVWQDAKDVLSLMPLLREQRVGWLEAPLPLENLDGYRCLQGHGIPIGGGDLGMTTRYEFADMLHRGKADILQPDITMAGGFSEVMRISHMANDAGRRVIPHGYKTNILNAINLNFLSQHWVEEMLEYSLSPSPLLADLTLETFPLDENGMVSVPSGPGLGVTLNQDALRTYQIA